MVMKTLDHWPDLGNDLNLISTGAKAKSWMCSPGNLEPKLRRAAGAIVWPVSGILLCLICLKRLKRTLGGWGKPANTLAWQSGPSSPGNHECERTPVLCAPSGRAHLCRDLQRMYRHFYFRVCDILNAAAVVESES